MNAEQAFAIYRELTKYVHDNSDKDLSELSLDGMKVIEPISAIENTSQTNIFDIVSQDYFGGRGQNTSSDELATVIYKDVYVNIWCHYGLLDTGCPFGFINDEDFVLCYADCSDKECDSEERPVYSVLGTEKVKDYKETQMGRMMGTVSEILRSITQVKLEEPVKVIIDTWEPYTDTTIEESRFIDQITLEGVSWGHHDRDETETVCGTPTNDKKTSFVLENPYKAYNTDNFEAYQSIYREALKQWRKHIQGLLNEYESVIAKIG